MRNSIKIILKASFTNMGAKNASMMKMAQQQKGDFTASIAKLFEKIIFSKI